MPPLPPNSALLVIDIQCGWYCAAPGPHDPAGTLARIAGFLGIGRFPDTAPRRAHATPEAPGLPGSSEDDRVHLAMLYRDDLARFADLSGLDLGCWPTAATTPAVASSRPLSARTLTRP